MSWIGDIFLAKSDLGQFKKVSSGLIRFFRKYIKNRFLKKVYRDVLVLIAITVPGQDEVIVKFKNNYESYFKSLPACSGSYRQVQLKSSRSVTTFRQCSHQGYTVR